MTAFETFVTTELPRRSPHLTVEITSYDGDPNDGGAPAIVKNAPKGTWYMQETPSVVWWRKQVSGSGGATSWVQGSGGAPIAHATSHEDGGTDELDAGDLGSTSAPGAGYILQADGAGGLSWATATTPGAHALSHQDGGSDEVATATPAAAAIPKADGGGRLDTWISPASDTVAGRIELATQTEVDAGTDATRAVTPATLAATTVTPESHASTHENGGADELSVAGLSGTLADPQTPSSHASTHENGGADELSVAGLSGTLADPQTPTAHASSHNAGGADALAIDAAAATGSLRTLGTGAQQAAAGNDARLSDARTPTSHASTHDAGGADAMAVDAAAGTGSLRTLGTGATQACAGNDARLSDARTPTSHASTHDAGGADALAIDAAAGTGSLRTLGTGALQACAGNDARLSDARTPTSHASTHDAGGGDALAIDAAAGTGSLRTLGTGATQACAGNDARLSDARTPTAHATSHQSGGADAVKLDDLAAPDDNTDLDATTGAHGLLPKLGGGTTNFLRADGSWAAPTTSGGSGWIYVSDAATQGSGTVTSKVWQDAPGNTVLQSFTASSANLRVTLRASYPKVDLGGTAAVLTRDAGGGYYSGQVDITVGGSGNVVAKVLTGDDADGAEDTVAVTLNLPPTILTLSFTGGYPGSQTELKAGDTYQVTGTTDKAIDQVEFLDYEAFQSGTVSASGTAFTVSGTIANRGTTAVLRPGRIRVRDAVTSAYSATRDTDHLGGTVNGTDLVNCNNLYPSVSFGAITYPGSQLALKNSETASVVNTVSNADTILYDSPNGDLSIASPTVIATPKTVTRIAGSYNVSTNNMRASANRAANDATTVAQTVVNIAHVALTLTVSTPAARLRSGGNDGTSIQNHTITITGNQQLLSAPTLDEDTGSSGTFIGSWAGAGTTWTRTLQVHDDDDKGTKSWQNPSATNLAGIVTTSILTGSTYVLGGFVARSLTFSAFSQTTTLNVAVVTYTKLTAGIFTATNQPAQRNPTQGDTSNIVDTYTIQSPLNTNPQTVFWNDQAAAGSNSSGTAQITNLQETV